MSSVICRSPAAGAYSEGFVSAKLTQVFYFSVLLMQLDPMLSPCTLCHDRENQQDRSLTDCMLLLAGL